MTEVVTPEILNKTVAVVPSGGGVELWFDSDRIERDVKLWSRVVCTVLLLPKK